MSEPVLGKLAFIGPTEQVGKNQTDKRTFAITYMSGKYEKKLALETWKERCTILDGLPLGVLVKVRFDVESREYEGRWYTTATAWSISPVEVSDEERAVRADNTPLNDLPPVDEDNLPF